MSEILTYLCLVKCESWLGSDLSDILAMVHNIKCVSITDNLKLSGLLDYAKCRVWHKFFHNIKIFILSYNSMYYHPPEPWKHSQILILQIEFPAYVYKVRQN